MTEIHLAEHDLAWRTDFAQEAVRLRSVLGAALLDVHHIGSTAVPELVAKPVIDMLAVVSSVHGLDEYQDRLAHIGYEGMGEFGIPGRRYFRKHAADGRRTHHLHAFEAGAAEIERHLRFRDYLRAHPDEAMRYAALKRGLAAQSSDTRAYTDGKAAFVREVDRRAAAWRQGAH
jgi:GrpB-like predicted nucleotidyltransferase (UPF0157 family)